jgi:hypothetical protein
MKLVSPALGAQVRREDPLPRYPRINELPPIEFRQIQECPPFQPKLSGNLRPHLIAALPNRRTNGGKQLRGPTAKPLPHRNNRLTHDPSGSPPPPGMNRSDRTVRVVDQQNRNAIGSLNGDNGARPILQKCVPLAENSRSPIGGHAFRRMNLLQTSQLREHRGNIGLPSAKTMQKPRQSIQFRNAIDVKGIEVEQENIIGHGWTRMHTDKKCLCYPCSSVSIRGQRIYAGVCICAIRTWLLKFSSIVSSSRTSVGLFTNVVIWSILSCSFKSP